MRVRTKEGREDVLETDDKFCSNKMGRPHYVCSKKGQLFRLLRRLMEAKCNHKVVLVPDSSYERVNRLHRGGGGIRNHNRHICLSERRIIRSCRGKTAFNSYHGLYGCLQMPFRFQNTRRTFQSVGNVILPPAIFVCVSRQHCRILALPKRAHHTITSGAEPVEKYKKTPEVKKVKPHYYRY